MQAVSNLKAGYVKPLKRGLSVMTTTFALYQLSFLVINLLQEDTSADFQDLGRKLLGGFIAAVAIAIAFTFIRLRLRDRKPPAQIISIKPGKSD